MTLTKQIRQGNKSEGEKQPQSVNQRENMTVNFVNIEIEEDPLSITNINLLVRLIRHEKYFPVLPEF